MKRLCIPVETVLFFVQLENCFSQWGVPLNSWIEVRQFTAACTFVSQGYGASIVSALDAAQFEGKGLVARPFEPDLSHDLSILRPITGARPLLVLDFIEAFVESCNPIYINSNQRLVAGK